MAQRNIKLTLEYDGTGYHGWQQQPNHRTIQAEVQSAVRALIQEEPVLIASGRTDSGVHALGQVVNFKSQTGLELRSIRDGLNCYLPSDIRVILVDDVPDSFHARFDAKGRRYRYFISRRIKAVGRQYAWFSKYDLTVSKMREASEHLLGTKAFTAFSKKNVEEKHYLCDVRHIQWMEQDDNLIMDIVANRFLHHMVRIIVGTLVEVGRGRYSPKDVQDILASGDRRRVGAVVPPHGLFLVDVSY